MLRTEASVVTDTPKDIATLYSRAHLEAARYWDFSASRQQVRGKFRARMVREPAGEFQPPQIEPPQVDPIPPTFVPASEPPVKPVTQAEPEEGVATRWYALHSVFAPAEAVDPPLSPEAHPPIVAFFSLAGGVGKTCLVATLGRALAALGEHLLLADTPACGMLPFYFGSRESRPGAVRTFFPPGPTFGAETDASVQVLNVGLYGQRSVRISIDQHSGTFQLKMIGVDAPNLTKKVRDVESWLNRTPARAAELIFTLRFEILFDHYELLTRRADLQLFRSIPLSPIDSNQKKT